MACRSCQHRAAPRSFFVEPGQPAREVTGMVSRSQAGQAGGDVAVMGALGIGLVGFAVAKLVGYSLLMSGLAGAGLFAAAFFVGFPGRAQTGLGMSRIPTDDFEE